MIDVADTPSDDDLERLFDEVEHHLVVVVRRARATWKEAAASIHPDLQPVGYKVLSTIAKLGQTNAITLAELLETDKSVVSRQVRMLEQSGLVATRADARDGRARVLTATPMALERLQAVKDHQQARLRNLLRTRSASEIRSFADVLRVLSEPEGA